MAAGSSAFNGNADPVGEFWDASPGKSALYINFLRGFWLAMRRVFVGPSEDDMLEKERGGGGILLLDDSDLVLIIVGGISGIGRLVDGLGRGG